MTRAVLAGIGPTLLGVAVVLATWQGACLLLHVPIYLVPRPGAVWQAALEHRASLTGKALRTLGSATLGLSISTAMAVAVALGFTLRPAAARAAMPILIALRSAPVVAVAPIIMLATGRGVATSVVVVTIVTLFPMLISVMRGLATDNRTALELLHIYGATRWQRIRFVQAPFALPFVFTGLRVAGAGALLGAMLSEWITGSPGLGYLILDAGEMREIEQLWAGVVIAILMSLVVFRITAGIERRVLRWRT